MLDKGGGKAKGEHGVRFFYALVAVEGVSYSFTILQGNLYCFRKLGHRATVPTSLTMRNLSDFGQVLLIFVCFGTASAQQLNEGIRSILLPNTKVQVY